MLLPLPWFPSILPATCSNLACATMYIAGQHCIRHCFKEAPTCAPVQEYSAWPVDGSDRVSPPISEWARCSGPYALCSLANWSVPGSGRGVDERAHAATCLLLHGKLQS